MRPLKIVMLTPFSSLVDANNGPLVHVLNLSRMLSGRPGINLTLISFGDSSETIALDRVRLNLIRYRKWYKYLPFIPILQLAIAVRKKKPDLVHLQGTGLNSYLFCGLFMISGNIPRVITVHGHGDAEAVALGNLRKGDLRLSLLIWAERQIVRKFDRIVCVTSGMKSKYEIKYGTRVASKLRVIANGVDSSSLASNEETRAHQLEPERQSRDFTVVTAKALTPMNGQEYLIRAFSMITREIPSARLILAGNGPDKKRLEEIVKETGLEELVAFPGEVPHSSIPLLISKASVAVVPSVRVMGVEEGSSIFLLEAMASGKPVIATNVGGNVEVIVDGKTGLLVLEKDPHAIAEALLDLYNNPDKAAQIGKAAQNYVLRERTWTQVAESYAQLYSEVLEEKTVGR